MKPLSIARRRTYFFSFLTIFVIAVPILILYAIGYRFGSEFSLVETGGVYIGADTTGAEIFLDDELIEETGTFRKAFFIQNIRPGDYTVRILKDGYYPWIKDIRINPQVVHEAYAFLIPTNPVVTVIPQIATSSVATTTASTTPEGEELLITENVTVSAPNPEYARVLALFEPATSTATTTPLQNVADVVTDAARTILDQNAATTSTTTLVERRGMQLSKDENERLFASWQRNEDSVPYYFCTQDGCRDEIQINTRDKEILSFDFFPGTTDVVLLALSDGIFVTEIDNRSYQNTHPLYSIPGADFRVENDDIIYIRNGDDLFRVSLDEEV